jgi:hypothetical protein
MMIYFFYKVAIVRLNPWGSKIRLGGPESFVAEFFPLDAPFSFTWPVHSLIVADLQLRLVNSRLRVKTGWRMKESGRFHKWPTPMSVLVLFRHLKSLSGDLTSLKSPGAALKGED